ncbi:extracellular solute-binding protein [Dermatobacter hominis]|uniref:extracellular solute-binding protein n=1 Tax=Dermatobacter hominis TaxID=2884263 RepID=UPI001D12B792|nr:extracellular solute-binding protein [Dermatobacter hominis]UDY37029.1 extracellular solute-binding protein [Dermatobacter hominis]
MGHDLTEGRAARRRRPRAWWLVGIVAAFALVAGACGGDDGGSGDDGDGGGGGDSSGVVNADDCPVKDVESATAPATVTVWHAYQGLQASTLQQIADGFNASQNKVKVELQGQGTYEELLKKFQDALANPGSLPDLVLTEDTTTQFMIDSGVVVPAASCQEADPGSDTTYDDVLPAVTSAYTVDDVLWPGAFSVSMPVLYVNKAILAQAGVDTTTFPQTIDELRSTAEKIKAANIPGVKAPLVIKVDSWFVENWLTGAGKPLVNNNNGRDGLADQSELAQEDTTKIYEWFKSMIDDGLATAIPSSSTGVDEYLALNAKSSAMLIQTSTAISTVAALLEGSVTKDQLGDVGIDADISSGLDIDVALQPGLEEAGQGQIGGSAWYLVKTDDAVGVPAAWQFVKYFLETPNQVTWTLQGSYLPVLKSAQDDPTLQKEFTTTTKGKWLNTAYQGLQNLNPDFPGPVIGPFNEFRAIVRSSLDSVAFNGVGTKEAIDKANTDFQDALDQYKSDVGG